MEGAENAIKASAIIAHTDDTLQPYVSDGLSSIFYRVYAIGHYQLLFIIECTYIENMVYRKYCRNTLVW